MLESLCNKISHVKYYSVCGKVTAVQGLSIVCSGLYIDAHIGSICAINDQFGEVISINKKHTFIMLFDPVNDIKIGDDCFLMHKEDTIYPSMCMMGRVLNALGKPLDGGNQIVFGDKKYTLNNRAPNAYSRKRIDEILDVGIKSINTFATFCKGQRMGIFSGSGVGKSMLLSMIAKHSKSHVNVIGLIGERGREVQEFIQEYLGERGMKNSVVIVATSDEAPLMRKKAAYLTMTIAEYFRDQEMDVLCMIDSLTRFAIAQREIGLSTNEPMTQHGYTSTVFSEIPRLLERAGTHDKKGSISGIFSVLVEGDDFNEPISDAVRGILDGHLILDRKIAERGRYPSVNVLKSISRLMPYCITPERMRILQDAREIISNYEDMEEIIKLGVYKKGSDIKIDRAISLYHEIENFLSQAPEDEISIEDAYAALEALLRD